MVFHRSRDMAPHPLAYTHFELIILTHSPAGRWVCLRERIMFSAVGNNVRMLRLRVVNWCNDW